MLYLFVYLIWKTRYTTTSLIYVRLQIWNFKLSHVVRSVTSQIFNLRVVRLISGTIFNFNYNTKYTPGKKDHERFSIESQNSNFLRWLFLKQILVYITFYFSKLGKKIQLNYFLKKWPDIRPSSFKDAWYNFIYNLCVKHVTYTFTAWSEDGLERLTVGWVELNWTLSLSLTNESLLWYIRYTTFNLKCYDDEANHHMWDCTKDFLSNAVLYRHNHSRSFRTLWNLYKTNLNCCQFLDLWGWFEWQSRLLEGLLHSNPFLKGYK